jgi:hypothetical protein
MIVTSQSCSCRWMYNKPIRFLINCVCAHNDCNASKVCVFVTNFPYRDAKLAQKHTYGNSVGVWSTDLPTTVCRRYHHRCHILATHLGSTYCQGVQKTSQKNLTKIPISLSSSTLMENKQSTRVYCNSDCETRSLLKIIMGSLECGLLLQILCKWKFT